MVDFVHNNDILESHFKTFSPAKLDKLPLEEVLSLIIKELKSNLDSISSDLEDCGEMDIYIEEYCEMLKVGEAAVMHLEFTLGLANSTSKDDIQTLKEKFSMIKASYERLKSIEDFTAVPAKYTSAIMVKVIIFELKRLMKNCFKRNGYGEIELIRTDENLAWIKILTARFRLFDEHYPGVVTFPKDDLFCQERSSPIWQDLYQVTTIKDNYTQQQVYSSFHLLFTRVNIVRILYQNHKKCKDISYLKTAYSHLRDIIYYSLLPSKADAQARLHLVNPLVEDAFKPWRIAEHPFICFYMNLKSPLMGQNELIYVPRLFPAITGKLIVKEYQDNTINKICPMDASDLIVPDLSEKRSEVLRELFIEKEGKIPVRILGPENLNLRENGQGIWSRIKDKVSSFRDSKSSQPSQDEQAIIIHMHGGGFVSLNSDTQKVYLSRWVKNLKLVHFSIDYRLAPANMYPDALDDVWQAYLWITNYAKTILGIENQKVIIAGDSAGGTLALTLSLRLIRAGLKPPHGIALMYPALSLDEKAFSPSYFLSLSDDMLPVSILKLILNAYIGKEFKSPEDPYLNPIVASDELLEKLPPVRIIAGSQDPLNDDNWRFVAKLRKLNKNVKFVLYENLPHGYLSHQDLEDFDVFVKDTCDVVQELIALEA